MARARSSKTTEVKNLLLQRLRHGAYRPGDRFLSARAVATRFGISYQTAHRLIDELASEGFLERRAASGTYVPGASTRMAGAMLLFDARARRSGSFGARLLQKLLQRLQMDGIDFEVKFVRSSQTLPTDRFPVIWECSQLVQACAQQEQRALLLNDRSPPGIVASLLDSVSLDDFSGGACAAQLLLRDAPPQPQFAILSGPENDVRSAQRVAGFQSVIKADVVAAKGWFFDDGYEAAEQVLETARDGLFCCNDRLAESVVSFCRNAHRKPPRLIGFDDAPVAEKLGLSTIAIPWREMTENASTIIARRLTGDTSTASQITLAPRPVVRN